MNPSDSPYETIPPDSGMARSSFVEQGNSLTKLLAFLRRRFLLLAIPAAVGLLIALLFNRFTAKSYQASAEMQITQDSASQFRLEAASQTGLGDVDSARIDTEIAVLRSEPLALLTIQALHLDKNKAFLSRPSGKPLNIDVNSDRHALIDTFEGHLGAMRLGHTSIIIISYESTDPQLAASICNSLLEAYKERNFKDNYESTVEVSQWLGQQLNQMRSRLEDSEANLLKLQQSIGLVGIDQTQSVLVSRLDALSKDYTEAHARRIISEARLIALRSGGADVLDTQAVDPVVTLLRQRQSALTEQIAQLSTKYLPKNPALLALNNELRDVNNSLAREERATIGRAEHDLQEAKGAEASLAASLQENTDRATATNSKAVQYVIASKQYESDRTLYQELQGRLQEAGILAGLHSSAVRIIQPADRPEYPNEPRTRMNLFIGLVGGTLLGLLLGVLVELTDTRIKSPADVEERLGLPLTGILPKTNSDQLSARAFLVAAKAGSRGEWSHIIEAYRALRSSLLLSRPGESPKVILITSSQAIEGKSTITSLLGVTLALAGSRVLLVDADLRRPTLHQKFALSSKVGLSSVLTNQTTLANALQSIDGLPGLEILAAGPVPPMPAELLGSKQMRDLIDQMRSTYDFIILDSPPVLAVTDATLLLPSADSVLLTVRYQKSSLTTLARSASLLQRDGEQMFGTVLNAFDLKSADYGYYYGTSYSSYTGEDSQG